MAVSVPASEQTSGKRPPQNQEAEVSVLGSILLSEQALDGILIDVKLRPDDFYRPRHGLIFSAMIRLKEKAQLYRIAHDDRTGELRSIEAVLHDELAKLERVSREGIAITGTPSGFKDIDELTGGFQPGNLIVLAARPAMGKSALVTNIAL